MCVMAIPTLDITDLDAVRQVVAEEKIGCIINCAAWTNVDKAETAGDIVETLNAIAPENPCPRDEGGGWSACPCQH